MTIRKRRRDRNGKYQGFTESAVYPPPVNKYQAILDRVPDVEPEPYDAISTRRIGIRKRRRDRTRNRIANQKRSLLK